MRYEQTKCNQPGLLTSSERDVDDGQRNRVRCRNVDARSGRVVKTVGEVNIANGLNCRGERLRHTGCACLRVRGLIRNPYVEGLGETRGELESARVREGDKASIVSNTWIGRRG